MKGRWRARPAVSLPPRVAPGGLVFTPLGNGEIRVTSWGEGKRASGEGRAVLRPYGCDLTLIQRHRQEKYRCGIARPVDEKGNPAPYCAGYCDNGEPQGIGSQKNARYLGFTLHGPLPASGHLGDDVQGRLFHHPKGLPDPAQYDSAKPDSNPSPGTGDRAGPASR